MRQVSEPTLQTVPDGWEFIYGGSVSCAYIPAEQGEGGLACRFPESMGAAHITVGWSGPITREVPSGLSAGKAKRVFDEKKHPGEIGVPPISPGCFL